ncbi:MAG: DUF3048 C-terminal domain-containing protein, partial [Candidatus Kerfeldbacteria bacterium]|nr:DUF3048 C-terminal domain-containing protein [Candidatus Kerfeldbacteria bacterium]
ADRPESVPDFVISFSGGSYEIRYQYDRERNDYLRLNGGVEHTDANTGEPIHVKNAVAMVIPPVVDVGEKGRLRLDVTGSGRAVIARDGSIIDGTWTKESRTDRTIFRTADGTEVAFNVGPTWIAVVLESQSVTF